MKLIKIFAYDDKLPGFVLQAYKACNNEKEAELLLEDIVVSNKLHKCICNIISTPNLRQLQQCSGWPCGKQWRLLSHLSERHWVTFSSLKGEEHNYLSGFVS
jgi:hypothetical protein